MHTAEYLGGLGLAIALAVLISMLTRRKAPLRLRVAIGVVIGFSGFLVGLMLMDAVGGVYLNSLFCSLLLSCFAGTSWDCP